MDKILYEKPTADVLVIRCENGILTVSGGGTITNAFEDDYDEL